MKERTEQIRSMHAGFINGVVEVCNGRRNQADLERVLNAAEQNGWDDVVSTTRKIVSGSREASLLNGLDEEDATIITAILDGLRNPDTLPKPMPQAEGHHAAPGLASIIHQASTGNPEALQALGGMGQQMTEAGGDMALIAAVLRRLLNGERDLDALGNNMGIRARSLLSSTIDELNRLGSQ